MNPQSTFVDQVLNKSFCLYSGKARLVYARNFLTNCKEDINSIFQEFINFDKQGMVNEYDGFVIGFNEKNQTANSVISFGAQLLFSLMTLDKGSAYAMNLIRNIDKENWWYDFGSTRYFILCFSNCYPENSPRYIQKKDLSFLMFQPVHSFDRKSIPAGTIIPQQTREMIRAIHKKNGKSYDSQLTQTLYEGQKIFHGLKGDYAYNWWQCIKNTD